MKLRLLLAFLVVLGGQLMAGNGSQVAEYDLLVNCIDIVKPNPSGFHCVFVDIKDPKKGMVCDPGSFTLILKQGSTTDKCSIVHLVDKTHTVSVQKDARQ